MRSLSQTISGVEKMWISADFLISIASISRFPVVSTNNDLTDDGYPVYTMPHYTMSVVSTSYVLSHHGVGTGTEHSIHWKQ